MPGGKQENIQNVTNQTAGVVPPPPKKVVQPAGGNIFDELKKTVEEKKKRQKSSPNAPEAVKEGQKGGQPAANDGKPTVKKQGPPLPPRNSQSSGGNVFDELKKSVAARNKKLAQSSPNLSGAANKEQPAVEKQETAKKKTGKRIPVDVKGKRVTPPHKKVVRSAVLPTSSSESASDAEARKKLFSELINKKNSQLSSNASGAVNKQEITEKKTSTSSTSSSKSVSDDLRTSKADLLCLFQDFNEAKLEYDQIKGALKMVKQTGYGIASPTLADMKLEKPEIIKQGGRYGVKLKAKAPSIHMIKVDVESTFEPIIGSEIQSKELINYLMKDSDTEPGTIWKSEIFGISLDEIVKEGIQEKLSMMPESTRYKLSTTATKIVNKGSNNLIAIVI